MAQVKKRGDWGNKTNQDYKTYEKNSENKEIKMKNFYTT